MKQLRSLTAPARRRVVIIADNARYHHGRLHKEWRERNSRRFALEFLPPYSPELNPIERVWGSSLVARPLTIVISQPSITLPPPSSTSFMAGPMGVRPFVDYAQLLKSLCITHGDLLSSPVGQRHNGMSLRIARLVWPRWAFRRVCRKFGLFMLITANK